MCNKKWWLPIGMSVLLLWITSVQAATLEKMEVKAIEGNRTAICLTMSEPIGLPKSFSIDNPSKIILDFPGVTNGLSREQSRPKLEMGALYQVVVADSGKRTRVVINLRETVPFVVDAQGNTISVILSGTLPSSDAISEPFTIQRSPQAPVTKSSGHCIENIDFRRSETGQGRVVIDMSDPNISIDLKEEKDEIVLRFEGTSISSDMIRKLDVTDFGTPVTMVNTIRDGNDVVMRVHVLGYSENIAYQAEKQFTLEVRALTKEEKAELQEKTFKYTGERLSLNFQNIEVRAVLQLIADFTGLNIVTSDTVVGNLTLRLKNVPWDEALDIILKTKGLAKRQVGEVFMVGPSEEMSAREQLELKSKQQVQELEPIRAEYIEINYAKASDIAALLKTDKNSLLSLRGTVSVDERTNMLLVQDTHKKLEEVRALVKRLDVPVRQVMIESRIIFATDDFQDQLGVQLYSGAKFRPGQEPVAGFAGTITGADNIAQGATPASQTTDNRLNVDLLAGLPSVDSNFGRFGLGVARLPGGTILDLELQALEKEGLGKTVSSPRLITSNQQQAYIESGEEIPYEEATSSGATSVSFKKAVLRLEVTPQITPDDHIILELKVNEDSRGTETTAGPAINTRQMATKVLVANGETIVLGGIYKHDTASSKWQVPFLGKLPVVGWLFRARHSLDQRRELLIFVTPKIIQDGMSATYREAT